MTRRMPRNSMLALLLAALMTGAAGMGGQVLAASDVHFSPLPFVNLANQIFGKDVVLGAVEALAGQAQVSEGSDGRITVLMVGSDWRPGSTNGERLDSIMVMSLNPNIDQLSAASIPRDTARIPIPPTLGGGIYNGKINGMFKWFKKASGGSREIGLEKFRQTVAYVLDIQIDYVAFVRFAGFDALVDEAGGVYSNIPYEIRDTGYIDSPGDPKGAKFLANPSALLKGASAPRCIGGWPKPVTNWAPVPNCTRAIVYVRSRKGSLVGAGGNNDYKRSRRQQTFVFEAIKRVRNLSSASREDLRGLANSLGSDFYTTVPLGLSDGLELYNLLRYAHLPSNGQVVFSPSTYATHIPGTSANRLNLSAVRAWCDQHMGPV